MSLYPRKKTGETHLVLRWIWNISFSMSSLSCLFVSFSFPHAKTHATWYHEIKCGGDVESGYETYLPLEVVAPASHQGILNMMGLLLFFACSSEARQVVDHIAPLTAVQM